MRERELQTVFLPRHAHDIRMMYQEKLSTAAELCEQLDTCRRKLAAKMEELEK